MCFRDTNWLFIPVSELLPMIFDPCMSCTSLPIVRCRRGTHGVGGMNIAKVLLIIASATEYSTTTTGSTGTAVYSCKENCVWYGSRDHVIVYEVPWSALIIESGSVVSKQKMDSSWLLVTMLVPLIILECTRRSAALAAYVSCVSRARR